jgi:hypothetical protein
LIVAFWHFGPFVASGEDTLSSLRLDSPRERVKV